MRILVTGGAGFIASHVTAAYLKAGHTVAILDDYSTGKEANVPTDAKVYRGSIDDLNFVKKSFTEFQPEIVNHHAAQISVVVSVREPLIDTRLNVLGTVNILEAARETPSFKKLIYAASGGSMYGTPSQLPCTEETPAAPASPYALSKNTAERYIWLYSELHGLKATVLRYSNVYGPRQDPHGEAGVCAIFAGKMLAGEQPMIFGDGSQVRDYVYVGDVAAASVAALEKGTGESFNIATGAPTSTLQVFETMKEVIGYAGEVKLGPARAGELQAIYLDVQKAKKGLDWQPSKTFKQGIEETVAWYRAQA
jgi:UDP-glucose 4-epimerase